MVKRVLLISLLFVTLAGCGSTANTSEPSQVTDNPSEQRSREIPIDQGVDFTTPSAYTLEVIEIGLSSQKLLFVDDSLWIIKSWVPSGGELVNMAIEEPYFQEKFNMPLDSLDMTYDGKSLWVLSTPASGAVVTRFNLQDGHITGEFPAGRESYSIAYGAGMIWVSDFVNHQILKLDAKNGSLTGRIDLDFASSKIGFADEKLWVIDSTNDEISIFDASSNELLAVYPTGRTPLDIAFNREDAWIINGDDDSITLIPFTLPDSPLSYSINCLPLLACDFGGIGISEFGVLVSSASNNRVYHLDPETGSVLRIFETRAPIDPIFDGTHIWVINSDRSRNDRGRTITKIQP